MNGNRQSNTRKAGTGQLCGFSGDLFSYDLVPQSGWWESTTCPGSDQDIGRDAVCP